MAVGNIEKRGTNSYRLTVSGGSDVNGKRIKYQKTIKAKSEREAGKALAMFVADIEAGKNFVCGILITGGFYRSLVQRNQRYQGCTRFLLPVPDVPCSTIAIAA